MPPATAGLAAAARETAARGHDRSGGTAHRRCHGRDRSVAHAGRRGGNPGTRPADEGRSSAPLGNSTQRQARRRRERAPWPFGPDLSLLAILPGHQQSGIGAVMLQWLEHEAGKSAGNVWACVSQFNHRARRFTPGMASRKIRRARRIGAAEARRGADPQEADVGVRYRFWPSNGLLASGFFPDARSAH